MAPHSQPLSTRVIIATLLAIWLAVPRSASANRLPRHLAGKLPSQSRPQVPLRSSPEPHPKPESSRPAEPAQSVSMMQTKMKLENPLESMEVLLQSEQPFSMMQKSMEIETEMEKSETQTQKTEKTVLQKEKEALAPVLEKKKEVKETVLEKEKEAMAPLLGKEKEVKETMLAAEKPQPDLHLEAEVKERVLEKEKEALAPILTLQPQVKETVLEKEKEALAQIAPQSLLKTKVLSDLPADAAPLQLYAPEDAITADEHQRFTLGTLTLALERNAFAFRVALFLAPVLLAIAALVCAQSARTMLSSQAKRQMCEEDRKRDPTAKRQCADKNCTACVSGNGYTRGSKAQSPATGWPPSSRSPALKPPSLVGPGPVPQSLPQPPPLSRPFSGSLLCFDGESLPQPEQRTIMVSRAEDDVVILRAVVDEVGRNPNIRVETVHGSAPAIILDTRHAFNPAEEESRNPNRHVVLNRVGAAFDDPGVPCACVRPAGGGTFTVHITAGPGLDEKRVALTVVTVGSPRLIDSMMDEQGLVAMRDVSPQSADRPSQAAIWVRHGADVALVTSLALAVQKLG